MKVQVQFIVGSMLALVVAGFIAGCGPRMGTDGGNIGIDSGGACGNGVIDPGEQCDPPGTATCDATCMTIGSVCGNNIVEIGEQCDPPDGMMCSATCQNTVITPPANPGAACTADADCSPGTGVGLSARCLDEATFGFPMGFCLVENCTTNPMTGTDDCPTASHCVGFGGTPPANYCLPDCTPSPTGIGGCRADTTATDAYACSPDVVDPAVGGCFIGCETDLGCNPCDMMNGNCFNDTATTCTTDMDCMASPIALACNTAVNVCYPDHAAGASSIGDPCTTDLDCPTNSNCATGGTIWPGGFCTQFYCDSYASIPEFACPAGSVCPSISGFFGGLLQLCAAPCTLTAATMGEATCDTDRGDNFHYVCIENSNPTASLTELFDSNGSPGFCFQCEGLFGAGEPACP